MPRIRQIKPEFFLDDELANCSRDARYLFLGLWPIADREGRLEYRPTKIKAQVFPYDADVSPKKVTSMLSQLAQYGFIIPYTVNGRNYIQIRSFTKHQHCHQKEPDSIIPPMPEEPDKYGASTVQENENRTSTVQESVLPRKAPYKPGGFLSINNGGLSIDNGELVPGKPGPNGPHPLFEIYKEKNKKLPLCLKLTEDRKKKCQDRCKDPEFIEAFTKAIVKAQCTDFLTGSNDRGWKADFDWFVKNDRNIYKVLEGKYSGLFDIPEEESNESSGGSIR